MILEWSKYYISALSLKSLELYISQYANSKGIFIYICHLHAYVGYEIRKKAFILLEDENILYNAPWQ